MKKKKFNLALIGAGKILNKHLSVICKFNKFKIIAIHSRTESKAKDLCKNFALDPKIYISNIDDLLLINEIDAYFICVSVESIDGVLEKILKTKKPFFIEKPPIVNLNIYKKFSKFIKRNKIPNMVGLNRRHYSNILKINEIFNNSGGIQSIQIEGNERIWQKKSLSQFRKKNWLILNSIHTLDLLIFLAGHIDNVSIIKTSNNIFSLNGESKKGINFTYTANWNSPGGWNIKIHNENYFANLDPLENATIKNKKFKTKHIKLNNFDIDFKPGFYLQIKNFYYLLKMGKNKFPSICIEECENLYNLINKIND